MANPTYKVGDLVQLKSGGPVMTVSDIAASGEHVSCKWFAGAKLEHGLFAMATLEPSEAKKPASKTSATLFTRGFTYIEGERV